MAASPADNEAYRKLLQRQQYGLVGRHSAVKICSWAKKSLRDIGVCYKEKFYGIRSHRCCQMTPSLGYCQNRCVFCWRDLSCTSDNEMQADGPLDEPLRIIDAAIVQQRRLMSGFKGFAKINLIKLKEAQNPMHFAISLSGEPLSYPKINELIRELHGNCKTTFVVTNGMLPERLASLEQPTQLYLSLDAPDESLFHKIDKPMLHDGWQRLLQSLDVLKKKKAAGWRTCIRITLIKDMNMVHPERYAELIARADPMFVEVKAYMFVGSSRERLSIENMPYHHEVKAFAENIAAHCGMKIIDEQDPSRVVLLMKEDFPGRIMKF